MTKPSPTKAPPFLTTCEVAKRVGVHANTVRLYEVWGFMPPIPRGRNGYRQFTTAHVDQMRLARLALHGGWPGRTIRRSALALVRKAAAGDLEGALAQAREHVRLVRVERKQAIAAAEFLERWAHGRSGNERTARPMRIGEAAALLGLTVDILRGWERNGLIRVPHDPRNGYRSYGAPEVGRLRVIRMLRLAGYSTMAILRLVLQLDRGSVRDVRRVLDTPRPDEDISTAADRWLSTLAEQEQRADAILRLVKDIVRRHAR